MHYRWVQVYWVQQIPETEMKSGYSFLESFFFPSRVKWYFETDSGYLFHVLCFFFRTVTQFNSVQSRTQSNSVQSQLNLGLSSIQFNLVLEWSFSHTFKSQIFFKTMAFFFSIGQPPKSIRFLCWVVSKPRTQKKRTPPEEQPPKFKGKKRTPPEEQPPKIDQLWILGVFLLGGSSSSGFWIWNPSDKENPPGGEVSFDKTVPRESYAIIWRCHLCHKLQRGVWKSNGMIKVGLGKGVNENWLALAEGVLTKGLAKAWQGLWQCHNLCRNFFAYN